MRTLLACLATTAVSASLAAGGMNLLENAGFENVSGPAGLERPDSWILDASAESATSSVRSGQRSLALNPISSLQGVAAQSDPLIGGSVIAANPGDLYRLSVYAQTLSNDTINGTGHRATIELIYFDAAGLSIASNEWTIFDGALDDPVNPEDQWILGETSLVAPTGAVAVGVQLQLLVDDGGAGQGTIYWDDASLVLVPAPGGAATLAALGWTATRRRR